MEGLHVAGYYNGNTNFVPFFTQNKRGYWYTFKSTYKISKPFTGEVTSTRGMELVAPELLAFWSEDD